jgi:hypothetical protein
MDDLLNHFRVGYNPEKGCLAFPYWDGDVVPAIKYRWPNGFKGYEEGGKRMLYNVEYVRGAGSVLLCEGESDTQAAYSALKETTTRVCGSPGAGVSDGTWQLWGLDLLFARRIFVAFDNDEAGNRGAENVMRVLGIERTRRIRLPDRIDLSEFIVNGGNLIEQLERADR